MTRSLGFLGTLLAASLLAGSVPAQERPALQAAAEAYDAGLQAHRQKDYARAAALFARADELAPDPAARLAALKSVLLSDDAVLGMTLVERAAAGPVDPALADLVKATREKFSSRAGRIRVACSGCTATLDGTTAPVGRDVWVLRGEHQVELTVEGRAERRSVQVDSDEPVVVTPAPAMAGKEVEPASGPLPVPTAVHAGASEARPETRAPVMPDAAGGGIPPVWFFASAGLTVVLGGLTIASGVDVRNREEDFYRAPTEEKATSGQAAETRTYILGAMTGVAGLATAAIGVFAVQWNGRSTVTVRGGARSGLVRIDTVF